MTTLDEAIAALKIQYPTLRTGTEEDGYTDLPTDGYNAKITEWASNQLADEVKAADVAAAKLDQETKIAAVNKKLATIGITPDDLTALGLAFKALP